MLLENKAFTCSVCGYQNGTHIAECIASLIKANTGSLRRQVNKMYNYLDNMKKTKHVNFREIDEILEFIRDQTGLLRACNESIAPAVGAQSRQVYESEGNS